MPDLIRLANGDYPEVHTLAIWAYCYEQLEAEDATNLTQVADKLGLPKEKVYRALDAVEEKCPQCRELIQRGRGRNAQATVSTDGQARRVVEALKRSLAEYQDSEEEDVVRLRIGASITLGLYIVPQVLKSFRDARPAGQRVEVYVMHDLPQLLRMRGARGEVDLVVTSVPGRKGDPVEGMSIRTDVLLPMRLICPQDHPIAHKLRGPFTESKFPWDMLSGFTVVLLQENRDPMPRYPEGLFKHVRSVVRVESIPQLHYTVLAGGDVMAFSFPQVFSPEEQDHLEVITIRGLYEMRLCLLASDRAAERHKA